MRFAPARRSLRAETGPLLFLRLQRGCGVRGWGRDGLGTGARGRGARTGAEGVDGAFALTVWAEAVGAPKASVNTFPVFVGAGLCYRALFRGRDRDVVSVGAI